MTANDRGGRFVLAGVGLLSFLGCIDLTIVNTAAPQIARGLDATVTETQLVVNVFVVALSMFMVTVGRMADILGRRRVLYGGAALFAAGSLGAGVATSLPVLVGFRFLQGAACAVLYTSSSTIVADATPPELRGKAIGTLFAINGTGLAIGPVFGGLLLGALDWHWIFLLNLPLIAIAVSICAVNLRESHGDPGTTLDPRGTLLLAAAIAGIVSGLTFEVMLPLVAGLILLGAFLAFDRRSRSPLVPLGFLRRGRFASAVVAEFGLGFFYTTALFLMPLFLAATRDAGEFEVGLLLMPTTATVAVLSPLAGRLVDRVGPLPVVAAGFAAFALSAGAQSQISGSTPIALVIGAFAAMGVGWACILGPAAVAALSAVPEKMAGFAVGTTWTIHNLGGAVGLAIGVALFRVAGEQELRDELADRGVHAGGWAAGVVTRPAAATDTLRRHVGGSADELAGRAITSGTHAAMLLLLASSIVALGAIGLLSVRSARKGENESAPARSSPADRR